jgi:hypothetical protein
LSYSARGSGSDAAKSDASNGDAACYGAYVAYWHEATDCALRSNVRSRVLATERLVPSDSHAAGASKFTSG